MPEIYKTIKKYRNYEVSNKGNIRNKQTERILKPSNASGYDKVTLYKDDTKPKQIMVHQLVAGAFLEKQPSPEHEIDHINRKKRDNKSSNLRWVTHIENMANRSIEMKPRKTSILQEHHITKIGNQFYFVFTSKKQKYSQCFHSLEMAIKIRDKFFREFVFSTSDE